MTGTPYFVKFLIELYENGGVLKTTIPWSTIVDALTARNAREQAKVEAVAAIKSSHPHVEIHSYFLEDIKKV